MMHVAPERITLTIGDEEADYIRSDLYDAMAAHASKAQDQALDAIDQLADARQRIADLTVTPKQD